MKSYAVIALSGLATLAAAVPDHFQSVASVLCTDAPASTVYVTKDCAAGASPVTTYGGSSNNNGGSAVTVTVTSTETVTATETVGSASSASAIYSQGSGNTGSSATSSAPGSKQTFHVDVGAFKEAGNRTVFQFRPNNITAAVGDVVLFNMLGKAHSVTQSAFAKPCVKTGPFDTELLPNPMNVTDSIIRPFTVNVTTPLWFYCKQTAMVDHCGAGMVFGINPKSNGQMQQFINMAIAQNGTAVTSSSISAVAPISTASIPASYPTYSVAPSSVASVPSVTPYATPYAAAAKPAYKGYRMRA